MIPAVLRSHADGDEFVAAAHRYRVAIESRSGEGLEVRRSLTRALRPVNRSYRDAVAEVKLPKGYELAWRDFSPSTHFLPDRVIIGGYAELVESRHAGSAGMVDLHRVREVARFSPGVSGGWKVELARGTRAARSWTVAELPAGVSRVLTEDLRYTSSPSARFA